MGVELVGIDLVRGNHFFTSAIITSQELFDVPN